SFLFPAAVIPLDCGSGRDEEPSGEKVLRLIQNPPGDAKSGENYVSQSTQIAATANRHSARDNSPVLHLLGCATVGSARFAVQICSIRAVRSPSGSAMLVL